MAVFCEGCRVFKSPYLQNILLTAPLDVLNAQPGYGRPACKKNEQGSHNGSNGAAHTVPVDGTYNHRPHTPPDAAIHGKACNCFSGTL